MLTRSSQTSKRSGGSNAKKLTTKPSWTRCQSIAKTHDVNNSVVRRLQSLDFAAKLTEDGILQDLLPNQKCVLLAASLVNRTTTCESVRIENDVASPPRNAKRSVSRKRKQRCPLLQPLVTTPHIAAQSPSVAYHDHMMKVWEDKLGRHELSVDDAVYLLVHEETVKILESALFLKAAHMDVAQMMEIEVTLEQLGTAWPQSTQPVNRVLFDNVWRHGSAFHANQELAELGTSKKTVLRPLSPLRSPSPTRVSSSASLVVPLETPYGAGQLKGFVAPHRTPPNQHEFVRLTNDLHSSHKRLHRYGEYVVESSHWIQEHCVDEIVKQKSLLFLASRKSQAAAKLLNVLVRRFGMMIIGRFRMWCAFVQEDRCREAVETYCKLKGASKILSRGRRLLRALLLTSWHRWKRQHVMERKMERLAAVTVVQSWMRGRLAKRYMKTYHSARAATTIQSTWRGYYCRKMLTRRRRYATYVVATSVVQRAFRAYYNRCQFAIHWHRHKASRCITQNLRRYCARRRLFKSWCARVARFHSAAVIQVWMRLTLTRIRSERARRAHQGASALTLQRFFRYAHYIRNFTSRVQRVAAARRAAAVRLQNAYRAKIARARFYALKDELEAQRRQAILKLMWDNAYATTIQRAWRKKRKKRKGAM